MSDDVPVVKIDRKSRIVQAGLVRFAELEEDKDRLASQIAELHTQIAVMTATISTNQQQIANAKEEAVRYMRSYMELLTSLNNAVMVLNTAQENARMTAEVPSAQLVPSEEPNGGALESTRRNAARGDLDRSKGANSKVS